MVAITTAVAWEACTSRGSRDSYRNTHGAGRKVRPVFVCCGITDSGMPVSHSPNIPPLVANVRKGQGDKSRLSAC